MLKLQNQQIVNKVGKYTYFNFYQDTQVHLFDRLVSRCDNTEGPELLRQEGKETRKSPLVWGLLTVFLLSSCEQWLWCTYISKKAFNKELFWFILLQHHFIVISIILPSFQGNFQTLRKSIINLHILIIEHNCFCLEFDAKNSFKKGKGSCDFV